ncbi:energy-coupling factor transporter transmembrane component T [Mesobacillus zeae]|uniref:Energy-coupling factor transporter transmembrane protein EcfT n=1 Tax=Mesobacillus zeae TaxID=1917180 RepID=A0A398B9B0_9BACI|nr:energy-coupling factor transporter transmembrane component T [Mesobacillus zeae]RID84253.1 energy-coupling factor transporter transmembrane protein EcfT [Mesobacillus zeae]
MRRFTDFHPIVTFLYYAGAVALFAALLHPVFLVAGLIIVLAIHFFYDRCRGLQRWFFLMLTTGLFIFILNPVFNERGRHVLFMLGDHRVTLEAAVYGGMSALSIIGVIAVFVSYNEVMTPNKLLFLFAKLLPRFAVLLMLTLRFIPLMRKRLEEIGDVQVSKGLSVHEGTLKERARNGMNYIQVLLTFSLEEAIQTAESMKARGYGEGVRSSYEHFVFKRPDFAAALYLLLLLAVLVYGRIQGFGWLAISPVMETFSFPQNEAVLLIIHCLFIGFPLIVETGEYIRWRILN